jgi:hypothetical protein
MSDPPECNFPAKLEVTRWVAGHADAVFLVPNVAESRTVDMVQPPGTGERFVHFVRRTT